MKPFVLITFLAAINSVVFGWMPMNYDEPRIRSTKYQQGKEYVYKYESQVLNGLPALSRSYSGVKVICDVKIDITSSEDFLLQLGNIQILTMNREVDNPNLVPPNQQIPASLFNQLPSEQASLVISKLVLPVRFRLSNNKITSLAITTNESNWSIDIKRSILAMFQVRLQPDDYTVTEKLPYNNLDKDRATAFSILESSLDGTCHSVIQALPSPTERNLYKVVKTRDPTSCQKINTVYKTTWFQHIGHCECVENLNNKPCQCRPITTEFDENNPEFASAKIIYEYDVISEDKQSLLIRKCSQSTTQKFVSQKANEQFLGTYSNHTLTLQAELDQLSIQTRGFSFVTVRDPFSIQLISDDAEVPMMNERQIMETVMTLVNEMVVITQRPERFDDHLTVFYQLVETLKLCKKDQLSALLINKQDYKSSKVILDAMTQCNTTSCDQVILEKILAENIPDSDVVSVFVSWSTDKVPTINILDIFQNSILPALQGKQNKRIVYQHALLCFGSMVHRLVLDNQNKKNQCLLEKDRTFHQSIIDSARNYEKVLLRYLASAQSEGDKIAVIKALTNMRSGEAIPVLENLLATTETTAVRVHAIYCLKNLCIQDKKKVLQAIQPLLVNPIEDSEIRTAALYVSVHCDGDLRALPRILEEEKDLEFKSFAVKYLRYVLDLYGSKKNPSVTGSTRLWARQQRIRNVLQSVKAFPLSARTEKAWMKLGVEPDTHAIILSWTSLADPSSSIPRSFLLTEHRMFRSNVHNLCEIGYRAEGLEKLMRPATRTDNCAKVDQPRVRDSKPSITLFLKVNNQQVSFLHLDENSLKKLITDGEVNIPIQLFKTALTRPEQVKKLTTNGLWAEYEVATVGVIDIDGRLKINLVSGNLPVFSFQSNRPARAEFKALVSQHVRIGFVKAGITSVTNIRRTISSGSWSVSYSMQDRSFNASVKDAFVGATMEIDAYANTFVLPLGLPQVVLRKRDAFKDIETHHANDRRKFTVPLDSLKSIGLSAVVEGDVYLPELYSVVRQRLHLLPSMVSFDRQHVRLSIAPVQSMRCSYEFCSRKLNIDERELGHQGDILELSARLEQPEMLGDQDFYHQATRYLAKVIPLYESGSAGSVDVSGLKTSRRLNRLSCRKPDGDVAITLNVTTQMSPDFLNCQNLIDLERPPIPGQETRNFRLNTKLIGERNSDNGQMKTRSEVSWGEQGQSNKAKVSVQTTTDPSYKDDRCRLETAFGCTDDNGIDYPVWFKSLVSVVGENTDLPRQILDVAKPYLNNRAQQVTILTRDNRRGRENALDMNVVLRPMDGNIDVRVVNENLETNFTRVPLPIQIRRDELSPKHPYEPCNPDQ